MIEEQTAQINDTYSIWDGKQYDYLYFLVLTVLIAIMWGFAREAVPLVIVFALFIGTGMLITRIIDKTSLSKAQKEKLYKMAPFMIVGIIFALVFAFLGYVFLIVK